MMANEIGKLAIRITADAVGVNAGIDAAKSALGNFASYVAGIFKGGLFGMASRAIEGTFTTAIGLATTAVETLVAKWGELAPKIGESVRNARRLGITVEETMGLQGALSEAGLGEMGMAKLLQMRGKFGGDFMKKLFDTADIVAGMKDAGQQVKLMSELLHVNERAAGRLVTLFAGGSDKLKEQLEFYKAVYAVSETQAARVAAANVAARRTGAMMEGFWNKVVAGMAPAVETVHKLFHSLAPVIVRLGELIGSALGDTLYTVVKLLEGAAGWIARATGLAGLIGKGGAEDDNKFQQAFRAGLVEVLAKVADAGEKLLYVFYQLAGTIARVIEVLVSTFGTHELGGFGNLIPEHQAMFDAATNMRLLADRMAKGMQFGQAENWLRDKIWGWFAQMDASAAAARAQAGEFIPYQATAAFQEGSKEAYSAIAKFNHEALMGGKDIQKQQLDELKGIRKGVELWNPDRFVRELKVDFGDALKLEEM